MQWVLPDEVCDVPVGLQGQGSLHLHTLLRRDSHFVLRRENTDRSRESPSATRETGPVKALVSWAQE